MAAENRHRSLKIKEHRDLLIQSIRTHLLPALNKQGFEPAPLAQRGPIDRESALGFPLGQLMRAGGEQEWIWSKSTRIPPARCLSD